MEACCVNAEYMLCISVGLLQFTTIGNSLTFSDFTMLFRLCWRDSCLHRHSRPVFHLNCIVAKPNSVQYILFCVYVISSTILYLGFKEQWSTLRFAKVRLKWKRGLVYKQCRSNPMFQSIEICHSIRLLFNTKRMIPKNNPVKIENSIYLIEFSIV